MSERAFRVYRTIQFSKRFIVKKKIGRVGGIESETGP